MGRLGERRLLPVRTLLAQITNSQPYNPGAEIKVAERDRGRHILRTAVVSFAPHSSLSTACNTKTADDVCCMYMHIERLMCRRGESNAYSISSSIPLTAVVLHSPSTLNGGCFTKYTRQTATIGHDIFLHTLISGILPPRALRRPFHHEREDG